MVTLHELQTLADETGMDVLELDVLTGRLELTAAEIRILDAAGALRTRERRQWVAIAASVGVPMWELQLATVLGDGVLADVVNRYLTRNVRRDIDQAEVPA